MKSKNGKFPANAQTDAKFQGQGHTTVWVGRDLQDHLIPNFLLRAGTPSWIRKLKSSGFALEHVKKLYYFASKIFAAFLGLSLEIPRLIPCATLLGWSECIQVQQSR